MSAPVLDFSKSLADQLSDGAEIIAEFERELAAERMADAVIRVWDGNWKLQHLLRGEDDLDLEEIELETGGGIVNLDGDHPAAQWFWKLKERKDRGETIDAFLTVNHVGKQYDCRVVDIGLRVDDRGIAKVAVSVEHDYEQLKSRTLWPTPTTSAGFQPFKVFMLGGPASWSAATALWLNLARAHGNPITSWTLDPVSVTDADYRNWPIVINPVSYAAAQASGVTTGLVVSRMKSWHEACAPMLDDANVTPKLRRWFEGDPLPWPGARISHGTLVVSFEYQGDLADDVTGGLASGIGQLARIFLNSLVEGIGGGSPLPVETGEEALTGQPVPPVYREPGRIGTVPDHPYVFYPAGSPGVQEFKAHLQIAKYLRFAGGGHSMPGVNELMSALVQAIGDALAAIPLAPIPPLGGVADALLKPFYEDVIMAFMTVYLQNRAAGMSKSTPYETFIMGADQAYTLSATMVLRTAIRATDTQFSAQFQVVDGMPWWVGGQGLGDMDLGTRILLQAPVDWDDRIYSQRIKSLRLTRSRGQALAWMPTVGAIQAMRDGFALVMQNIEKLAGGLKQAGVF